MITNITDYPLRLVHGGTIRGFSSGNRCYEPASSLQPVELSDFPDIVQMWRTVLDEPSRTNIMVFFNCLIESDINICGRPSTEHVYDSNSLLQVFITIHENSLDMGFNLFPRSGGLREVIILSIESDKEYELLEKFIGHPKNESI